MLRSGKKLLRKCRLLLSRWLLWILLRMLELWLLMLQLLRLLVLPV